MKNPFVLIALPGTGKTTILNEVVKNLNTRNKDSNLNICVVDEVRKSRMNSEDAVVKQFILENRDITIFKDGKKVTSGDFIKSYGEEKFRVLEERFVLDILETVNFQNTVLDLGGKSFLRKKVEEKAKEKGVVPVFLYAEKDENIDHLSKNKAYEERGNYKLAGEKGWEKLARQHKRERLPQMIDVSSVVINISDPKLVEKSKEQTNQDSLTQAIPSVIADELLFRVHEYVKSKSNYFCLNDDMSVQPISATQNRERREQLEAMIIARNQSRQRSSGDDNSSRQNQNTNQQRQQFVKKFPKSLH